MGAAIAWMEEWPTKPAIQAPTMQRKSSERGAKTVSTRSDRDPNPQAGVTTRSALTETIHTEYALRGRAVARKCGRGSKLSIPLYSPKPIRLEIYKSL